MIHKIGKFLLFLILTFLIIIAVNQINWVSHTTIKSENEQIEAIKNNTDSIVCILKANKRKYKVGEIPDIEVEIINKTDSTILMVGSLDGSDLGVRYPISQFLVKHQAFGNVEFPTSFCPMLNKTRALDFKRVESGFSFNPYEAIDDYGFFTPQNLAGHNFIIPGIYTLSYYYSTIKVKGLYLRTTNEPVFREAEPFHNLWRQVPKIELKSNTITIEYNL